MHHRHICESKCQLSAIYNIRQGLYCGSALPTFSGVHWPRSGGFDNVCVSRAGQWTARPQWIQIRNLDKGGRVDAQQGKFGFNPKTRIIQDGKAREGTAPCPSQGLIHKIPWRDDSSAAQTNRWFSSVGLVWGFYFCHLSELLTSHSI